MSTEKSMNDQTPESGKEVVPGPCVLGTQLHITICADLIPGIAPVVNRFVKPDGGLWTSSYVDGASAWIEAYNDMEFGDPLALNWFLLDPDPAARVLRIANLEDLRDVVHEYPFQPYPGSHILWPDFERIAESWDAMHLTHAGQWATRLTVPSLYGWDCESTLWFRWCFTACRRIAAGPGTTTPPDHGAKS